MSVSSGMSSASKITKTVTELSGLVTISTRLGRSVPGVPVWSTAKRPNTKHETPSRAHPQIAHISQAVQVFVTSARHVQLCPRLHFPPAPLHGKREPLHAPTPPALLPHQDTAAVLNQTAQADKSVRKLVCSIVSIVSINRFCSELPCMSSLDSVQCFSC